MNEHDATEVAFKNGYKQGVKDLAKKLKGYYRSLAGKTVSDSVEYNIDIKVKELLGEEL